MKKLLASLLLIGFIFNACQKEVSFETGGSPSEGLLQSDVTGDCLPKNVVGVYEQGTALNGTNNYIEVTVDVTKTGTYTIYTDTANGVYFRATGTFTAVGDNVVKLRGNATPAASGTFNFNIQYDGQTCAVAVDFLPSGAGGPAVFSLNGSPGNCTGANVQGGYATGIALTSANKVTISVNVTTIGTYNIRTTTVNGMTFTATGAFLTTGPTTVDLIGSGTPAAAQTSVFPVTAGTSTCSFSIPITGPAVFTINCTSATINGTYEKGVALTSSNTVDLDVNVTTAGPYTITTTAVNGMTFTGSGNLALGPQTITLTGSGTPTQDGTFTINVNSGTASCGFSIVVDPSVSATGTWKFTEGSTTYQGTISEAQFDGASLPPAMLFYCYGTSPSGEEFEIDLLDISGSITTNENYDCSTFTGLTNTGGFYFTGIPPKTYDADFTFTGNTVLIKVTSHNTTAKTIAGTFSGNAQDNTGAFKAITNGTFSVTYQ